MHVTRFLLSDGRTVDVASTHDNSDLRGAVLKHFAVKGVELRIVGSTVVARS